MIALTRVLVPTNLGEPSKAAVTYGVAFARQFGARLFVLRVLPREEYETAVEAQRVIDAEIAGEDGAGDGDEADSDTAARHAACESLRQLLDPDEERDTHAEYLLLPAGPHGPGAAIAGCARELGIELIVMGKHRMGVVEHFVAGSVTEKLMRQAPCPVLIVQHAGHEFVVPDAPEDGPLEN